MPRIYEGNSFGPYRVIQPLPELHKYDRIEAWLSELPDGRQVVLNALRIPHGDLSEKDQRIYKAFRNEVKALTRLRHLNIIRIYPLHPRARSLRGEWYLSKVELQDESWWFWTMEPPWGDSLDSRMQRMGRLPLEEAAEVIYQIGMALDYIHSKRIVHLNVHPQSIFFRYPPSSREQRAELVLTDFTSAAEADREVEEWIAKPEFKSYMPPERLETPQLSSTQPLDNRPIDIYSLGVLFYHMLAGTPPFSNEKAILEAAPPPLQRFDIPKEIEDLILQALHKDPAQRPSIEDLLTTLDVSVPPPRMVGIRITASIGEIPAPVEIVQEKPPPAPSFFDRLKAPWLALGRLVSRAPSYPAPILREPPEETILSGKVNFTWDWEGRLKDNEAFELRIWKEGRHEKVGESREPELEVDLDTIVPELPGEGNDCLWSVVIIQKTPYKLLSEEAQPRGFTYSKSKEEASDVETNEGD